MILNDEDEYDVEEESLCSVGNGQVARPKAKRQRGAEPPAFPLPPPRPLAGGGGGRKPAKSSSSSSSSSRQWKPRASREFGHESPLQSQKEGSSSSSPSVSSKKLPQQMVTPVLPKSLDSPVQPPKSLDSQKEGPSSSSPSVSSKKSQMVTPALPKTLDSPVQPRKSLDSPLMMGKQVQPPKSQDLLVQSVASIQLSKPLDSSSASCGSGTMGSLDSPVQTWKFLDSPLMMAEQVQPPKCQESLVQMVASIQISRPLDSSSTSCVSGTVGSDLGAAPFDICMGNSKGIFKLERPLHVINKEKRLREKELSNSVSLKQHLRPGMVLLKSFLKPNDQVKIIKLCRELGVGTGGFYQPGYKGGPRLNLRMMCLGKNWDPDSSEYGDIRPIDGAPPPQIPPALTKLVQGAIEASHEFLKEIGGRPSFELPLMSPDICIVNYYSSSGKLGLHQDKDESIYSRRLPVVSFSLGDTAEFLYGDGRDDDKASKVDLESGDVVLFGGPSRLIFHGVSKIKPKTAPSWVTDEANLRPGRLNLTFRKY